MKDLIVLDILTVVLVCALCLLSMVLGYQQGFKVGVIAAWECHTDMECENLERLVK
jgi:hypothetical protein